MWRWLPSTASDREQAEQRVELGQIRARDIAVSGREKVLGAVLAARSKPAAQARDGPALGTGAETLRPTRNTLLCLV
jgi:hypothetical protein